MTTSHVIASLVVVSLATLALTGCAPAAHPAASPSHSPLPTSAATAPTAPGGAAPKRLDIGCADVSSPAGLTSVLGAPVTVQVPARVALAAYSGMPYSYFVEQAGGLECLWSDGAAASSVTGAESELSGAVAVLPDATAQWAAFQSAYGFTANTTTNCQINDGDGCQFDALVGNSWVEVTIGKLAVAPTSPTTASAAAATFFEHVVSVVRGAHYLAPVPRTTTQVECNAVISPADFASILGISQPLSAGGADGGMSIEFAGAAQVGESRCFINIEGSDNGAGLIDVLPGGAWAARTSRTFATLPSVPATVSVPGLAATEQASIRYSPSTGEAVLDFTRHGAWVEVSVDPYSGGGVLVPGDVRSKLIAVAAKIVANLG